MFSGLSEDESQQILFRQDSAFNVQINVALWGSTCSVGLPVLDVYMGGSGVARFGKVAVV